MTVTALRTVWVCEECELTSTAGTQAEVRHLAADHDRIQHRGRRTARVLGDEEAG